MARNPEKPLGDAIKVKPGLFWRPQDVKHSRFMEYLPRRTATQSGTSSRDLSVL